MSHLQIKNVPPAMHTELRRRADQAGLSLRDYVLQLIQKDLTLPSVRDWLAELDELEHVPAAAGESSADTVTAVRRERDEARTGRAR